MQFRKPPGPETTPEDPAPTERADVRLAANRCPFCRDDVLAEAVDGVVCTQCLTRHHQACWDEAGRCSSCGHAVHLSRARGPRLTKPKLTALIAAIALALVGALLAAKLSQRWAAEQARLHAVEEASAWEAQRAQEQAAQVDAATRAEAAMRELVKEEAARKAAYQAEVERVIADGERREKRLRESDETYRRELERVQTESLVRAREAERARKLEKVSKKLQEAHSDRTQAQVKALEVRRRLERAESYFEAGKFSDCLTEVGKVIALDNTEAEAWILRGQAHEALLQFEPGIAAYERALRCPLGPDRLREVLKMVDALDAQLEAADPDPEGE